MKKYAMVLILLGITIACNLPVQTHPQSSNATEQIATDVELTLTSFAQTAPFITQQPEVQITSENPDTAVEEASGKTQLPSSEQIKTSPLPSQTPTPSDGVKASLGDPDWKVSFTNGKDGFYDDDDEDCVINPQHEQLVLTSTMRVKGWHSWSMHYHMIKNFYLEGTIHTQNCSASDEYGLIFRAPDYNNGYFFGLTCDGKYSLRALKGEYKTISDWTSATEIHSGSNQTNILGIKAVDNHFSLYINDELVKEIDDGSFPDRGIYGVFIAAYDTPGFTIGLDDMAYWILD